MSNETPNEEKTYLTAASLGAVLYFIIPLIMWALKKDYFSDYTKKFLVDILNFELIILIISIAISVVFCFAPYYRWVASVVLFIFNMIVALQCYSAVRDRKEYNLPIKIQFIKE